MEEKVPVVMKKKLSMIFLIFVNYQYQEQFQDVADYQVSDKHCKNSCSPNEQPTPQTN